MINQFYLQNIEQIKKALDNEEKVTLFDFVGEKEFVKLQKKVRSLNYKKEKNVLTHSYSKAKINSNKELTNFISKIIHKKITKLSSEARSFAWKDYTILNDKVKEKQKFDVILDLTDSWNDSFGGSSIYVDGTGNFTKIPSRRNTLTIVKRKKGVKQFVKYVNNSAGRKKRFLIISTIN